MKRSAPDLARSIADKVAAAAGDFGASILPSDESFFLYFDEEGGCARLRASETARFLERELSALAPRLHGWSILLGNREGKRGLPAQGEAEALYKELRRGWYRVPEDGLWTGGEGMDSFGSYIESGGQGFGSARFPYAEPALPEGREAPEPSETSLERFIDEAGRHGIGDSGAGLLLAVGPDSAPRDFLATALETLYPGSSSTFLWLHAGVGGSSPYGPFLRALAMKPTEAELEGLAEADRLNLRELGEVADFVTSSPYRQGYSEAIRTRIRLYLAARLALYARGREKAGLPAIVVFDGLDRFPEASLELLGELLDANSGEGPEGDAAAEMLNAGGLVIYGTATKIPRGLDPARLRILAAPPPSPASMARAALIASRSLGDEALAPKLAAIAGGDGFRLGLALRLAGKASLPGAEATSDELAASVLSGFPPEFSDFILAHALAEDVLDAGCLDEFLLAAGFVQGIRPLLYRQFAELGFLSPDRDHRILHAEAVRAAAKTARQGGEALLAVFAGRLLAFHSTGKIRPSVALFDWIAAQDPAGMGRKLSLFYLDCAAADALYGSSRLFSVEESPIIAGISDFRSSYAAGRVEDAALALERLEEAAAGEGELAEALASLSRAYDEYARGSPLSAANRTRPALMDLHALRARRTEAKAHRLLGLCALAQNQIQEGLGYLSNAFELAMEVPDPLEGILSGYAEAGALLVSGDLAHAALWAGKTAELARSSFRVDWEAACAFLEGRIAFELGRYEEADVAFGQVRAIARVYRQPPMAARAEIWSGRAAAYMDKAGQARELLGRRPGDPEAECFLAELAWFEGKPGEAASHAAQARACLPGRSYKSADAISWDSGFDCLEARSIGFTGELSYLADQVGAFEEFAVAVTEREEEVLLGLARRTREERLAEIHPLAHLYHFYCYLALKSMEGGPLDPTTVLGKSFKALQNRTARMEEASLKDEYLENNRWNREILAEARKHKFI